MEPNTNLVQEYIDANEEHRIGLFLAYRDLRDIFNRIEQEEFTDNSPAPNTQKPEKVVQNRVPQAITSYCRCWLSFCKSRCC